MVTEIMRVCPYCSNGGTIRRLPLYEDEKLKLFIAIKKNRESAKLETDTKIIEIKEFYYCPFCGRQLNGRRLCKRKFREERDD